MGKLSGRSNKSTNTSGSSRQSVKPSSVPPKKARGSGSWNASLDDKIDASLSSNTTCVTSEMSVSPSDEDGRPKFKVNHTPHHGRKKNSKEPKKAMANFVSPPLKKKPAPIIESSKPSANNSSQKPASARSDLAEEYLDHDVAQISEEEECSNDDDTSESDSSESEATENSEMDEDDDEPSENSEMDEDVESNVPCEDSDEGSHESNASSEANSSLGQPYSKEWEESEGSSHAYLSSRGIGNPEKMGSFRDNKHQGVAAHSPRKTSSQRSELFSASYGSMSLGGDSSLSSMDSFRNSPETLEKPIVLKRVNKPNPGAKPKKPILREKEQPKLPTRRRYYSSGDDSDTASELSELAPASGSFKSAPSASTLGSSFKVEEHSSTSSLQKSRDNRLSINSGDVSIPTISDDSNGEDKSDEDGSLPSFPPFHPDSSSRLSSQSYQEDRAPKTVLRSTSSSFTNESWNTPLPSDSASHSFSTADEPAHKTQGSRRARPKPESESSGSWTVSADWSSPKDAGGHWASITEESGPWQDWDDILEKESFPISRKKSLSGRSSRKSLSSKDSPRSKSSRKSITSKGSLASKGSHSSKSNKSSRRTSKKQKKEEPVDRARAVPTPPKPRSADDRNAPWYCGDSDDDDGSYNSDGSSVLSAFKKTKKKKAPYEHPTQDKSMSFSALMGSGNAGNKPAASDMSMSLGQLEQSMSLGNLQQNANESMSLGDLGGGGIASSRLSKPLNLLSEEPLEKISLSDLYSEEDKGAPLGRFDSLDESAPVGQQTPSPDGSQHSADEDKGDEDKGDGGDSSPRNPRSDAKEKSIRMLRWIVIVGFVLFLIFDLILLSIFLAQRKDKNAEQSNVLATVPDTLCWDWVPGEGKSILCSPDDTSSGGAVANLVAQAIRAKSPLPVDISVIPAGLTKSDISKGDFAQSDAEKVLQPTHDSGRSLRGRQLGDAGTLVIVEGTGARVLQVLERSLEDSLINGQTYSYPYASGLRFSVDSTAPKDQRVISPVAVVDGIWDALSVDKLYTVITTKDWADSYFLLQSTTVQITPLASLTRYARDAKTLVQPEFSTREFVALETQDPPNADAGDSTVPVVESNICLEWVPGQGLSNFCSKADTALRGGAVGNLVAWGLLTQFQESGEATEIVLLKASDCQIDIAEGPFEEHDATALIPVNEEIVFLTVTGHQIINALEAAVEFAIGGTSNSGSYPYAGGLRFRVNPNESQGNRLVEIELFRRGGWKALSPVATYQVATTFTLAEGGAGYANLADAPARIDTGFLLRSVFMSYAADVGILRNPPESQFSTQRYG